MDNRMYEREVPIPRKRKRRSCFGTFLKVLAVLAVPIAVVALYLKFYKPSGNDKLLRETVTDEYGNVIEVTHEFEAVDGEYNVLVLGHDKEAKLTDVVMLVNVNNNDGKLTVMQIPRDTYFGGKGAPSASVDKVNEIFVTYYRGYLNDGESEKNAYKAALEDTKKLLSDALAVNIDFAAIMDLSGFKNIVDAIGGVTLDVPAPLQYYDEVQDLRIDIPAGRQTLDGDMAEGFVRFREGYVQADLGRINAQKLFMNAFLAELKSEVSLTNVSLITSLARVVASNTVTDMRVDDIVYFAKSVLKIDSSYISMLTLPSQTYGSYVVMNREATLNAVNKYFNTFSKDITTGLFDSRRMFCNASDASFAEVYNASPEDLYDGNVYSGDEMEEGIFVPMDKDYLDGVVNNKSY